MPSSRAYPRGSNDGSTANRTCSSARGQTRTEGNPLGPDNRPWYQVAFAEIRTGHILASLAPEWAVLHAVPVGAGTADIDHVLIGPAGVFTLNTKDHNNRASG
ncbi:nuclease-related domain-containing protein [Arthrobacter sp. KK5.5]|uniref:nuclease-related domain-containing protein n=1 Tax=Arthrobacter sp. KK5.5 TaxID=3373084 RepID=UPI003EE66DF7